MRPHHPSHFLSRKARGRDRKYEDPEETETELESSDHHAEGAGVDNEGAGGGAPPSPLREPFAVPSVEDTRGVDGRSSLARRRRSRQRRREDDDSDGNIRSAGHRGRGRLPRQGRRAAEPLADNRGRPGRRRQRALSEDDDDSLSEEKAGGVARRGGARSPSSERDGPVQPLADGRGRPRMASSRWTPERLEIKIQIESRLQPPFQCPGTLDVSMQRCSTQTPTWRELMQHMADLHDRYLCDMPGCRKRDLAIRLSL